MRFLSMVRLNENTAAAPSEQLVADMRKLMDQLMRAGVLIRYGRTPTHSGGRPRASE